MKCGVTQGYISDLFWYTTFTSDMLYALEDCNTLYNCTWRIIEC